jgi:hypothetical protein
MELDKSEPDQSWFDFSSKELVGLGSNGNRVYKVINKRDNKVKLLLLILDLCYEKNNYKSKR